MTSLLSRRNIDFILYEWLCVLQLTERSRFAEHSRDTFDAALDSYERIATECFAPHNRSNDTREPCFADGVVSVNPEMKPALRAFADAGLMAAANDYERGGMQLPYLVERAGMMFLYAANVATAAYPMLTMANANLLSAYADPAVAERYVADMLAGRIFGTMCLSEPQAVSSLADITTRAELQGDGRYRLFGNKMWISGGDHDLTDNILHLVLAKIPSANGRLAPGVGGISLFLVPKYLPGAPGDARSEDARGERNDVTVAGVNHKLGYRGTSNCLLNFGEGRFRPGGAAGALGHRVGAAGQGLACMFHMMNEARIAVGAGAVALGSAGFMHSIDYASTRRQGRLPVEPGEKRADSLPVHIIEHTDVRRMLLAQKAYVEGGAALVLYCARLVDEGRSGATQDLRDHATALLDLLTPVAKSWPSSWCLAANDLAIQVHGGCGYTRDFPVEQFWRDNRLNAIHEGTHGVQAADLLGRKVMLNEGAALAALERRLMAGVAECAGIASIAAAAEAVAVAWDRLRRVTTSLRSVSVTLRLANAGSYLDAFGHVVVGWLWLEQAKTAARSLQVAHDTDAAFYRGKVHTCAWFARWELPRVQAWLGVLDPVDTSVLDMQPEWF
jgi:alkylation response protein AidB-like acyl-CoA dehydrogenase